MYSVMYECGLPLEFVDFPLTSVRGAFCFLHNCQLPALWLDLPLLPVKSLRNGIPQQDEELCRAGRELGCENGRRSTKISNVCGCRIHLGEGVR